MKIFYDKEVDAAYIKLSDVKPTGVIEVEGGINIDTTNKNEIVGIEILDASQKFSLESLFSCDFHETYLLDKANL